MVINNTVINDSLKFLAEFSRYDVKKLDYDDDPDYEYEITDSQSDIVALVDHNGKVDFKVSGVYNSGCNYADIDVVALDKFRKFVDTIRGLG